MDGEVLGLVGMRKNIPRDEVSFKLYRRQIPDKLSIA